MAEFLIARYNPHQRFSLSALNLFLEGTFILAKIQVMDANFNQREKADSKRAY